MWPDREDIGAVIFENPHFILMGFLGLNGVDDLSDLAQISIGSRN